MKILSEVKNSVLKRSEVFLAVKEDKNPQEADIRKKIAEHFNKEEGQIVVKSIRGSFGSREFVVEALVYNSVQDKEKIEPKLKVKEKKA